MTAENYYVGIYKYIGSVIYKERKRAMRKRLVLGLLGVSLLLSACSKSDGKKDRTEEHIGQTFDTVSETDLGNYKEELLDLSKIEEDLRKLAKSNTSKDDKTIILITYNTIINQYKDACIKVIEDTFDFEDNQDSIEDWKIINNFKI